MKDMYSGHMGIMSSEYQSYGRVSGCEISRELLVLHWVPCREVFLLLTPDTKSPALGNVTWWKYLRWI